MYFAYRLSVAALYMLYKIRCKPMHALYGVLPVAYVPVSVPHDAVITHWDTDEAPLCRTSQYCVTFIAISIFVE